MAKTVAPKRGAGKSIVSLKVTLRGTRPPVWRRRLLPGEMTLGDLHQAIQAAMGWHDGHLHAFDIGGRQYGDRHIVDDVADENRLTLNSLLKSGPLRLHLRLRRQLGTCGRHRKTRAGRRGNVLSGLRLPKAQLFARGLRTRPGLSAPAR